MASDNKLFVPPFVGTRVAKGIPIDDIVEYLAWGMLGGDRTADRGDRSLGQRMAGVEQAGELVDDAAGVLNLLGLAVEREQVAAQEDAAADLAFQCSQQSVLVAG